ncbi:type II CAAX prenyl endopeptidase Rce1 family protein [Aeromicrobium sp. UC242_57]|uniref:CPBP family glutamic-type intramembrane protease n=1 Tax=Aeromicrobium sp. UC242_57 TaxID=3374624 RepID=UPI0037A2408A
MGVARRRYGARQATWWSAAAFGLWHVPAGLRLLDSNEALASASEGSWLIGAAVVIAIVAFTAAAGIVFAEMRRRSGSLLAPAGLHWATNSIGTVLSAVK